MSVSIKREAEIEGESPAYERKEKEAGEPMYDKESDIPKEDEGVDISEEFQKQAHHITHKASKHQLHHLSRKIDERHGELNKAEMLKNKKGHSMEYSTADMPKGD